MAETNSTIERRCVTVSSSSSCCTATYTNDPHGNSRLPSATLAARQLAMLSATASDAERITRTLNHPLQRTFKVIQGQWKKALVRLPIIGTVSDRF